MIEDQIEQDLKAAMLSRDVTKISTLRGVKSAFLYAKVSLGKRDTVLSDQDAIQILQKEAKKRQESADLYTKVGEKDRAQKEMYEKSLIEVYLPSKISEDDLKDLIQSIIKDHPEFNMGQIISEVKSKTAGRAEGGDIARLVKVELGR
jgi:hypothetical protein